jgi:maleylacetate reductase
MTNFIHESLAIRTIFGCGTVAMLADEIDRLRITKVFVLSTPGQSNNARNLTATLGSRLRGFFDAAAMHTPVEVTERAVAALELSDAGGLLSIGGSSTTGLGKALALRTGLPLLAVPTTYAGSEMTALLGQTHNGVKTTLRDPRVVPRTVIYDADLTLGLPADISASSGVNAIAHAVEALYARDRNPIVSLIAADAITALAKALPKIVERPTDREERERALRGAWQAGICLASVSMGLHHKLCHVLGGAFSLPHAQMHAAILPHATAYTAPGAPEAMRSIARAIGATDAAQGLFDLIRAVGAGTSLRELGMPENGIGHAADLAVANAYWNPRPIEREAVRALIARAWAGDPPKTET